jgi:phage repressor protein C with HTH and peptisase S24 domain
MKQAEILALAEEQQTQRYFINAMMESTGWSASYLAKNAGLAHTTVSRFLSGTDATHCLSTRTLSKLENAAFSELSRRHGAEFRDWPADMAFLKHVNPDMLSNKRRRLAQALAADDAPAGQGRRGGAGEAADTRPRRRTGASEAQFAHAPDIAALPRNFPVRGIALGGEGGEFTFNGGEIDIVRRPLALIGVDNAFAVYVAGDSMAPRFEPGELLFVHPGRPPQPGDDVLVESHGGDGEPGACYLKRLVRRAGGKVVLGQFNPVREIRIDAKKVQAIHKVLTRAELQ